jgi:hypothetical protein
VIASGTSSGDNLPRAALLSPESSPVKRESTKWTACNHTHKIPQLVTPIGSRAYYTNMRALEATPFHRLVMQERAYLIGWFQRQL